jgi:hypothetical protein
MSNAQTWLVLGGLFNLFVSVLVAYGLFWQRSGTPEKPAQRYGLVAHKLILWDGFLLLCLATVIDKTIFPESINLLLAALEVIASLATGTRVVVSWLRDVPDEIARGGFTRRIIGVGNMLHLLAISGIFYGVARGLLGF